MHLMINMFKVVLSHFVEDNIVIFSLIGKFGCLVVRALASQQCNVSLNPAWCHFLFQYVDWLVPCSMGFLSLLLQFSFHSENQHFQIPFLPTCMTCMKTSYIVHVSLMWLLLLNSFLKFMKSNCY